MDPVRVMLVDDNPTFLRITARFIAAEDWIEVHGSASSGDEAVNLAPDLQPDVILLDLNMPGAGGLEAIPRLRQIVPEARIIALTLLDTDSYRDAALEAGADRFVPKASMDQELIPVILEAVSAPRASTAAEVEPPPRRDGDLGEERLL